MKAIHLNTVSSSAALDLLDSCEAFGIHHNESPKLQREALLNPEVRIDESQIINLWNEIAQNSSIPHIGLLIGQRINPLAKGLLASWVSQSETLGEALIIFQQHISLMSPSEHWSIETQQGCTRLVFTLAENKNYPISAIERSMSALLSWGEVLTGQVLQPSEVTFNFPLPNYITQYQLVFGSDLRFNSEENSLSFPAHFLDLPVKSANPLLKKMIQVKAKEAFDALSENSTLSEKIKEIILNSLAEQKSNIDYVSEILCISRQTLYRHLKQEDTNFKTLLNDVRKEQALKLLQAEKSNMTHISLSLGFNETSSFYKAFHRWYGITPGEYLLKHKPPV